MSEYPEHNLPATRYRPFNININNNPEMVRYEYEHLFPSERMLALYQTIKHTLPGQPCHIIQFASAYRGEGANVIAFETALRAATQIGLRVLYIDTGYEYEHIKPELTAKLETTLDVLLQTGGPLDGALVGVEDTHFIYSLLRNPNFKDAALANLDNLQELLNVLRGMYDLIVFPSPMILSDILCASLCKLADGTIVVVEAERTRAPVLRRVKETIQANGGNVIGAILNKRRLYIPRFFYRFI